MRTPRRLVAALAATALSWTTLTLVLAAPAQADIQPPHDPATYYASAAGLTGNALALELHDIIDGHAPLPYTASTTDVWDALDVLDADPNDPTKVIDFYSGDNLVLTNKCGSSCALDGWNREHTWPQSHGLDLDDGNWPAGTDLFHMRVSRGNTNGSRGDLDFDDTVNSGGAVPGCPVICQRDGNSFEGRDTGKGDLARGLFYMAVRYNGGGDGAQGDLVLVESIPSGFLTLGKLSRLVEWSLADPPDDRERWRNDKIDSDYQHNRNPFIDHPEWVCSIWGDSNPVACSNTNQPPTITSPTTKSTPRDTPFSLPLTATDPNGDPLTWSVVAPAAAHGTASITGAAPNFSLSYTPAGGYSGPDAVGVQVSDGQGGVATATIQITVTAVNQPPTVQDIGADEPVMVPKFNSKQITLLGNDPEGDTLTYSLVTPPGRGTVTINGNVATYTATSSSGIDGFTYRATDPSNAQSPTAEVTVQIASSPNAPVVTPVPMTTTVEDTAKTVTLTASDVDGDPIIYSLANPQPTQGTVVREGDEVTYTPNANSTGSDSFGWSASDGTSTENSTVSITITPVNDAPVANAASTSTPEDTAKAITLTGSDVDGPQPSFAIEGQPSHGSVSLVGATATYTPAANFNGQDSFSFTASDGTDTSTPATVSIDVMPVNDAPTATAGSATTAEDDQQGITLAGNDLDAGEGDTLTYAIAATPGHGVVTLDGNEATYTPATNYHGPDSFTFTVNDGTVTSPAATVDLTVTPVNDPPTVDAATLNVTAGSSVSQDLTTADVDGDTVTITSTTTPAHGSVTFTGTEVTYTPSVRSGTDSFAVTVSDGHGGTDTATVDVTISARTATVSTSTPAPTRGKPVTTTVAVGGQPDFTPSGQVTLKNGAVTVGIATLSAGGTATITWTPTKAGPASLVATYAGDNAFEPATSPATPVPVAKSASTFTFGGKVKPGKRGKVKVTIGTVAGVAPTGSVTLKVGSRTFTATVNSGVATFKIGRVPTTRKKLKVTATYGGDSQYLGGSAKKAYRLS